LIEIERTVFVIGEVQPWVKETFIRLTSSLNTDNVLDAVIVAWDQALRSGEF
jgi:hypothetical protein